MKEYFLKSYFIRNITPHLKHSCENEKQTVILLLNGCVSQGREQSDANRARISDNG